MKNLLLLYYLSCPSTEFINNTKSEWTAKDQKIFHFYYRKCTVRGKCLTLFRKGVNADNSNNYTILCKVKKTRENWRDLHGPKNNKHETEAEKENY